MIQPLRPSVEPREEGLCRQGFAKGQSLGVMLAAALLRCRGGKRSSAPVVQGKHIIRILAFSTYPCPVCIPYLRSPHHSFANAASGFTPEEAVALCGLQGLGLWPKGPIEVSNAWYQSAFSSRLASVVRFVSSTPSAPAGGQLVLGSTLLKEAQLRASVAHFKEDAPAFFAALSSAYARSCTLGCRGCTPAPSSARNDVPIVQITN